MRASNCYYISAVQHITVRSERHFALSQFWTCLCFALYVDVDPLWPRKITAAAGKLLANYVGISTTTTTTHRKGQGKETKRKERRSVNESHRKEGQNPHYHLYTHNTHALPSRISTANKMLFTWIKLCSWKSLDGNLCNINSTGQHCSHLLANALFVSSWWPSWEGIRGFPTQHDNFCNFGAK